MKTTIQLSFLFVLFLISCGSDKAVQEPEKINWSEREADMVDVDSSMIHGTTYLSVYSQIYSQSEHNVRDLTVTVSMRNPDSENKVFLKKINSYNTEGHLVKNYIEKPVYILPMETLELVIEESDDDFGTGGNFLFDWTVAKNTNEPIFESIMISTAGQQGISFVTTGKRLN